jgi:alanine racemase
MKRPQSLNTFCDNAAGNLVIDLEAIADNYRYLAARAPTAETAAAVKADAYGLGLEPVVKTLEKNGCRSFFVALHEEGICLRKIAPDAEIFVLCGIWDDAIEGIVANRLTPVLNTAKDIALWTSLPDAPPFALHVDTGLNRLGLPMNQMADFPDLNPSVVMTHFACADDPSHPMNQQQIEAFNIVRGAYPKARASLANSACILARDDCRFDLTRPGIALYGGEAINDVPNPMRPVVQLKGRILQIRNARAGETIGYGGTHSFTKDTRVAIVGVGYADGYNRALSGSGIPMRQLSSGGVGMIDSHKVPIIGRISMDLTAFDISALPENAVSQGDWVDLINDEITVDEVASIAGTIGYEILTSLGRRYRRSYINA